MSLANVSSIRSEQEAIAQGGTLASVWMSKIERALEDEDDWRKEARLAVAVFEAISSAKLTGYRRPTFNIFHSNISTLVPAVYNQTPTPDVRRRFGDKDAQARYGAQIAERCIQTSLDCYDFDHVMRRTVRSSAITGRCTARVRYEPVFGSPTDPDGALSDRKEHEEVHVQWIHWENYINGPASSWELRPWEAFRYHLTRDELTKLMMPPEPPQPPLEGDPKAINKGLRAYEAALTDWQAKSKETAERIDRLASGKSSKIDDDATADQKEPKGILQTTECWEVWDKESRSIIWVTKADTMFPLAVFPDPMRFKGFFCTPRPLMPIEGESSLTPVCPYSVYSDLIAEIDDTTRRIKKIIDDMRVRAIADPKMQKDLEALATATDGEAISSSNPENFQIGRTAISNLVMFWPNDQNVQMLKALMEHREAIKQIIYEVTGLSDILRGSTKAEETATAQQIKATWGSQRVEEFRAEVGRFARELFSLIAEVIFTHFDDQTIRNMTLLPEPIDEAAIESQVQIDPQVDPETGEAMEPDPQQVQTLRQQAVAQAQQAADQEFGQALQLMRSHLRWYRVDIETDSTIKANLAQDQEQFSNFLGTSAQFGQATASMAQTLPAMVAPFMEVFASFVRKQKLGKNIEDVLDRLIEAGKQPPVDPNKGQEQPPPPDPAQLHEMTKDLETHKAQLQGQQKQQDHENAKELKGIEIAAKQEEVAAHRETEQMKLEREDQRFALEQERHSDELEGRQFERKRRVLEWEDGREDANRSHDLAQRDSDLKARDSDTRAEAVKAKATASAKPPEDIEAEALAKEEEDAMNQALVRAIGEMIETQTQSTQQMSEALQTILQSLNQSNAKVAQGIERMAQSNAEVAKALKAPRKIVRDKDNRPVGSVSE